MDAGTSQAVPARPDPRGRVASAIAEARTTLNSLLPLWFVACSILRLSQLHLFRGDYGALGLDFRIYRGAALNWLNGVDPWSFHVEFAQKTWSFAGMPTDFQLLLPFALVPYPIAAGLWVALSLALVTYAIRRLGLPLWFLAFPPITEALVSWNPQLIVFGLLMLGAAAGDALGVAFKVYALMPILVERRWRAVAGVVVAMAVSFALTPAAWLEYATRFGEISHRLVVESSGGFSAAGWALPALWHSDLPYWVPSWGPLVALAALAAFLAVTARDVRAAGWLAAPLLWPAAEWHYATFALPVARPLALWLLAYPSRQAFIAGMILLAVEIALREPALVPQPEPLGPRAWLAALGGDAESARTRAWRPVAGEEDEAADAT